MASSSSNQHVTVEVREEYPYPSYVCAPNFVTLKLSHRENYSIWETQMICLLKSHDMLGFIDGTFVSPQLSVTGKDKVGDDEQYQYRLWARSDALVKGWILGSLSENTLIHVLNHLQKRNATDADSSAKDVWDELHTIYGRPQLVSADEQEKEELLPGFNKKLLYDMISRGRSIFRRFLRDNEVTVTEKLTNKGNTALHLAVASNYGLELLENLLNYSPENTQLLDLRNSDGHTVLHVAATIGNTEAASILVGRDPNLLFARDNKSHTPLALAVSNMHSEMSQFLLHHMKTAIEDDSDIYSSISGDELPSIVISCKEYSLAFDLIKHHETLADDAELMALAQNYPREFTKFQIYIGTPLRIIADDLLERATEYAYVFKTRRPFTLCIFLLLTILPLFFLGILFIFIFPPVFLIKKLASPFITERVRVHNDAATLLLKLCSMGTDPYGSSYRTSYTKPLFEATRKNAYEVVYAITRICSSDAILSVNEDSHNILQYAVINRSEKVYNVLYHQKKYKNIFRTMKDSSGNNLLHLAARLAPSAKLNRISGAALQIQRELQWFKELEGYISPLNVTQKNSLNETPQIVFTREHKDLVIEGEKWLKAAAESYTITAALITTIVFAAAITVPGGNNQDNGIPVFTNNPAFNLFAISDAISLFTSVTSLLMFLSIMTTRFAEQDFLFKLPTKLIIGLTTLFISTTTMIIAFGATLYLVFGQKNKMLLIPIAVLTCLPITSFVTLQIPFIIELISSTYGRSIFRKKF